MMKMLLTTVLLAFITFSVAIAGYTINSPEEWTQKAKATHYCELFTNHDNHLDKGGRIEVWAVAGQGRNMGTLDDQISHVIIHAGRWEFFKDLNFTGPSEKLGPGRHSLWGSAFDDQITSFKAIK